MNLTIECVVDMDQNWTQRCTIKADKFKFNQVLCNFVSNALKFCSTSKREVKVAVERIAVPERLIRPISPEEPVMMITHMVSDNGSG